MNYRGITLVMCNLYGKAFRDALISDDQGEICGKNGKCVDQTFVLQNLCEILYDVYDIY